MICTLKTVAASPIVAWGNLLTPRLHLTVSYTKGGKSGIHGAIVARGFYVSVQYDRVDVDGARYVAVEHRTNPTQLLRPSERYNASLLEKLANDIRQGDYASLVESLYAEAVGKWSEHDFPKSILPLVPLLTHNGS